MVLLYKHTKILLFDKNFHILILTKKESFFIINTNYFTLATVTFKHKH